MKIGDKVQYPKGSKTLTGVIHGIRRAADENGQERIIGYLVDTGKDVRVDEETLIDEESRDQYYKEFDSRVDKARKKGAKHEDAVVEVLAQSDLPKIKTKTVKFRQPEQVEVSPEDIKLA